MFRVPFGMAFFLILVACSTKPGSKSPYTVQYGILPASTKLQMQGVQLDSIQFADAKYRYVLTGTFLVGREERRFSLMLKSRPARFERCEVLFHAFPLKDIDSSAYTCSVYPAAQNMVIDWENGVRRLKLVFDQELISAH